MAVNRETAITVGKQFASMIRSAFDSEALVYLFGSYAKDMAHDRSDIDIAVVSETFGSNVIENRVSVSLLGYKVHPDIEAHPFSVEDWKYVTPFIKEIKNTGVIL
jgi:predicted nucleotidyltransferase